MAERRGRGRPPLAEGEPTVRLPAVLVPESLREDLRETAEREGAPEAEVVREALRRELVRLRRRAERRELLAESEPPEGPDVAG